MPEATPIHFPLLNPNEPEAAVAALHVSAGQRVAPGELLCTLETTKSTAEMVAEGEGYIVGLQWEIGQIVRAGEIFCYLASAPDWRPPEPAAEPSPAAPPAPPQGLRITQPALALARARGLDLNRLPLGPLLTEKMVHALAAEETPAAGGEAATLLAGDFDPTAILVYGGGGHGKSLIDLLRLLGVYRIVGVIDDGLAAGERIMGLPVLGGGQKLDELYAQGIRLAVNAVGGIGNPSIRIKVFAALAQAGFVCPAVAHPSAVIEPSAVLSPGVQVFPHAYVGSETRVGFGAIVNTGSIVSHDVSLGRTVNISPGAMLAGSVVVGDGALIGMGVTINLNVTIGAGARIGNNATVKADVPANGVVRAGMVYPP